ncbi:hypothetical protein EVAR_71280_1 [Eumeta japonica]|uniref:Uncharacterized protein n=1 Tax=Eumeta variegata TaxID=151549 RepID=A0A4C1ZYK9_EUMVA|nr:hypothetical protein EVAR_71271_1 [Eumeta japonica]GBP93921.1 hypothetical protein EVAR_71273_1 [Eumeta japonica]GBP93923.1 hypothetical protein EVAR_71275_1 [Eumeta japonica]GBP93924.1 hypothetical protein EVAR_71276_1 [Eumeta japonica]GBP93925.1 hypothetical protein EVAR_71277_1 [Eumeta japonica]
MPASLNEIRRRRFVTEFQCQLPTYVIRSDNVSWLECNSRRFQQIQTRPKHVVLLGSSSVYLPAPSSDLETQSLSKCTSRQFQKVRNPLGYVPS